MRLHRQPDAGKCRIQHRGPARRGKSAVGGAVNGSAEFVSGGLCMSVKKCGI